jgi:hypothetical protein
LDGVTRPRLLCAWLLGAGACVHVDSPLPPPDPPAEHTRCERLHPIADVAVWGELKSADPVDLTPIGADAVMIHLADPKQGRIGQLLVDLADKSTELRASWATGDERRLYVEPYLNTEDERWRLLVRDRFDSDFVRVASETRIADRHPHLAPGSKGWGWPAAGPATGPGSPGHYALTRFVTHRDEIWFAATERHCSDGPRERWCFEPPEAFAVHLAPDATVTSYDLLEVEAEMDFLRDDSDWLGDILVASVGDRLVLAWAYDKRYRTLRVAELRCPANAGLPI